MPSLSCRPISQASPSFTFKHALIHEVAYGSLLADQRRHLHSEIVGCDRGAAARSSHGQCRAARSPCVFGKLAEKASRYSRAAGNKAFARSSNREAVAHYEQALTWLAELPETREKRSRQSTCGWSFAARSTRLRNTEGSEDIFAGSGETGARARRSLAPRLDIRLYGEPLSDHRRDMRRSAHIGGALRSDRRGLDETRLQVAAQYYIAWASYIAGDYAAPRACAGPSSGR